MAEQVGERALFWPGGQGPAVVTLLGAGCAAPQSGRPTLIISAGPHRYLVDEADVMLIPQAGYPANLSPLMGNA